MPSPTIEVLLATYQAGPWLDPLVDSVLAQKEVNVRILARDDGSTDGTAQALEVLERRKPDRLRLLRDGRPGLGPAGNFSALLEASSERIVALADQDDVWDSDKLAVSVNLLCRLESSLPAGTPVLVHGDLRVVDAELRVLHPSFAELRGLDLAAGSTFPRLLMQNVITGCTVVANRALVERAVPVPVEAPMHDHWLGLVAAAYGTIGVNDDPPRIAYRQHGRNSVGARDSSPLGALRERRRWSMNGLREDLAPARRQAEAFLSRFGPTLSPSRSRELKHFLSLFRSGYFKRRWHLLRGGCWKHGWLRNLDLLARL